MRNARSLEQSSQRGFPAGGVARRLSGVIQPRFILFGSFAITSVVNYAFGLGLGWLLVPGDFGLVAFVQSVLLVCGLVLQAGIPWSLTRSIVNTKEASRGALVRGAFISNLILSVAMGILVVGLYALGPLEGGLESFAYAGLLALMLPPISLIAVTRAVALGLERYHSVATLQIVEVGLKALVATLLVVMGFSVTGALVGLFVGSAVAGLVSLVILLGPLNISLLGSREWPSINKAVPMFVSAFGLMMILNIGLMAVKLFGSDDRAQAGYYQAGVVLANIPYYLVASAVVPVLFTRLARMTSLKETVTSTGEVMRLVLAFIIPFEIVLAVVPNAALALFFPARYEAAIGGLRLLAIGNGLILIALILSSVFQAIGRPKISAIVLLTVALVQGVTLSVIVPDTGQAGAALGLVLAAGAAVIILGSIYLVDAQIRAKEAVRVVNWLFRYALSLVGAATGGYLGLLAVHNIRLAVIVSGICYLIFLFSLRLITLSDVKATQSSLSPE